MGTGSVTCGRWMQGGDGEVVGQPVVAAYRAKAQDVAFDVEDLEPLHVAGYGESGDDVDLPEVSNTLVSEHDMAALDETLVSLRVRVVEAPTTDQILK